MCVYKTAAKLSHISTADALCPGDTTEVNSFIILAAHLPLLKENSILNTLNKNHGLPSVEEFKRVGHSNTRLRAVGGLPFLALLLCSGRGPQRAWVLQKTHRRERAAAGVSYQTMQVVRPLVQVFQRHHETVQQRAQPEGQRPCPGHADAPKLSIYKGGQNYFRGVFSVSEALDGEGARKLQHQGSCDPRRQERGQDEHCALEDSA